MSYWREKDNIEKLQLSLQSPLPNEQDMAIGVCALMSQPDARGVRLRLDRCPNILNMLLAHVGVFTECKELFML